MNPPQGVFLIFDQLKRDHDRIRALLKKMESTGPKAVATRIELLKEFIEVFSAHNRAEELFFYKAILRGEYGSDLTHDQALESLEDHTTLTYALNEIEDTDVRDNAWMQRLRFFKRAVERHFVEEEKVLFKNARALISQNRADELGEAAREMVDQNRDPKPNQRGVRKRPSTKDL